MLAVFFWGGLSLSISSLQDLHGTVEQMRHNDGGTPQTWECTNRTETNEFIKTGTCLACLERQGMQTVVFGDCGDPTSAFVD